MKKLKKRQAAIAITSSIIMFLIFMVFIFLIFPVYSMIISNRKIESAIKNYSQAVVKTYDNLVLEPNKDLLINQHFDNFLDNQFGNTNIEVLDIQVTVQKPLSVSPYNYHDAALINDGPRTEPFFAIYSEFKVNIPLMADSFTLKKSIIRNIN